MVYSYHSNLLIKKITFKTKVHQNCYYCDWIIHLITLHLELFKLAVMHVQLYSMN